MSATFLPVFGLPSGAELLFLFGVLVTVGLQLWAIIDALRSSFPGNQKVLWLLVVIVLPCVGSLLYLALGRKQRLP